MDNYKLTFELRPVLNPIEPLAHPNTNSNPVDATGVFSRDAVASGGRRQQAASFSAPMLTTLSGGDVPQLDCPVQLADEQVVLVGRKAGDGDGIVALLARPGAELQYSRNNDRDKTE